MMINKIRVMLFFVLSIFCGLSCSENFTPAELAYIKEIEQHRQSVNDFMKNDPYSPFNYKGKVEFHPLNYFDIDPGFRFKTRLIVYAEKDTIIIYGTKGEPRPTTRYGYILFNKDGIDYKLNVYRNITSDGKIYYSIWFTDRTTNSETYGVGRYINFEKVDDPAEQYTIDFNLAYNPYCAYSKDYSCAIPTKEDFIDLSITAGEKKFHE